MKSRLFLTIEGFYHAYRFTEYGMMLEFVSDDLDFILRTIEDIDGLPAIRTMIMSEYING